MGAVIDGEPMEPAHALASLAERPHLICHSAFFIERLGVAAQAPRTMVRAAREQRHFDVAELFAFVCPARFATPTPVGFARSLTRELGSRGITANVVAPGFIETDMTSALPEAQQQALLAQIPLGHLGKPSDIAHAVAYLASPQAAYITGQELHVNGGMFMA